MGFSRTIKNIIFITPWIIAILSMIIIMIPIYLLMLFCSYLIFIYEWVGEEICPKK